MTGADITGVADLLLWRHRCGSERGVYNVTFNAAILTSWWRNICWQCHRAKLLVATISPSLVDRSIVCAAVHATFPTLARSTSPVLDEVVFGVTNASTIDFDQYWRFHR